MKGLSELRNIGLTSGEIRIYEALLDLGETTRTNLAKKSGISPSKIYDVANRLIEKGIISSVKKDGVIHFSAVNPNRIKDFLEKKEKEISEEKKIVEEILPMLLSKYGKTEEKTDIGVLSGWEGMETAFEEIAKTLKKGDENFVFGASFGQDEEKANTFFSKYYKKVHTAGYSVKIIFNESVRKTKERTKYYLTTKRHQVRYLYQDTFTEVNIYKNTVLIILLLKKPIIIRIKNQEAVDSYRKYFESLWKQAKP
jgi:predicted transcriptional regulator